MSKTVLIISPYFPPSNAADMQRIRMSLPYFERFGWKAEVVTVNIQYAAMIKDNLLLENIPSGIKVHQVKALEKKITSKVGLGSLALRSLWFYKQKVNELLNANKYDLIYFSTTQFPVCILGAYWKRKFNIPYIIDFQDPWYSDYYQDKPKSARPPKYWFSYRLNKWLEPIAMNSVDGLISVSKAYIATLQKRYPITATIPAEIIPFGFDEADKQLALTHQSEFIKLLSPDTKNLVYVGRGGDDMHQAIRPVFKCLRQLKDEESKQLAAFRFYFIGTSYAPAGQGKPSIMPIAREYGLENQVIEMTDRISFYHTLNTLQQADALFIPGSDDPKYTASKLYPYLFSQKPLLAVFNPASPALKTLEACGAVDAYDYHTPALEQQLRKFFKKLLSDSLAQSKYDADCLMNFTAVNMTRQQCLLFDQVLS